MEVWKTEDQRVNFEKRFAYYKIYTWALCHSYLHEKQTSRIQSLKEKKTQAVISVIRDPFDAGILYMYRTKQTWRYQSWKTCFEVILTNAFYTTLSCSYTSLVFTGPMSAGECRPAILVGGNDRDDPYIRTGAIGGCPYVFPIHISTGKQHSFDYLTWLF